MFNDSNQQNDIDNIPWNTERNWEYLDDWQRRYIEENYSVRYSATTSGDYDWETGSFDEDDMDYDEFRIYFNGSYIGDVESEYAIKDEMMDHFFDRVCCQEVYDDWRDDV